MGLIYKNGKYYGSDGGLTPEEREKFDSISVGANKVEDNHETNNGTVLIDGEETTVYDDSKLENTYQKKIADNPTANGVYLLKVEEGETMWEFVNIYNGEVEPEV